MARELARCVGAAEPDWPSVRANCVLPREWAEMAIRCFARGRDGFTEIEFDKGMTLTFPIGRRALVEKILAALPCRSSVARLDLADDARRATVVLKVTVSKKSLTSEQRDESQSEKRRLRFFAANAEKLPCMLKSLGDVPLAEPVRITYFLSDERAAWLDSSPDAYVARALADSQCLARCLAEVEFGITLTLPRDLTMAGVQAREILDCVRRGRASIENALTSIAALVLPHDSVFERHSPLLRERFAEAILAFRRTETPARFQRDTLMHLSSWDSSVDDHLPVSLEMSARYDQITRALMEVWHAEEHYLLCGLHELANGLDSKYPPSGQYVLRHGTTATEDDEPADDALDSWIPPLL